MPESMTAMPESTLEEPTPVGRRVVSLTNLIIIVACAVAVLVAVVLVGTGRAPTAISLRAATADYQVRLDLDSASRGRRTATVEVLTDGGQPVVNAQVSIHTAMPAMTRMPGVRLPARQVAPGRYEANGELFTMLGDWTVTVRISEPGSRSAQDAAFPVRAVP